MPLANPYLRALLVNLVLFVAACLRLLQQMGTKWTPRHTLAAYTLAAVCLLSTAVIGTLSRRSPERWSWLKVMMLSIACGLISMAVILTLLKLTKISQGACSF